MNNIPNRRCRLEVKNEILGDSVFWEGTKDETPNIRNKPGRMVAEAVFRTGEPKSWGMWHGFPVMWRCEGCGYGLTDDEVQAYGEDSFCHTVAVAGRDGEPEPAPCGPVKRIET